MTMATTDVPPKTPEELGPVVAELLAEYRRERPRLAQIAAYMANRVDTVYVPSKATNEYRALVDQSRFNVLPRVVKAVAQNLFVDGYRPTGPNGRAPDADNSPIWDAVWQPNRMDARQAGLWRPALTYGYSFATVLPGSRSRRQRNDGGGVEVVDESVPVITPYSPLLMTACYDDPANDEWPRSAMIARTPMYAEARPGSDPVLSESTSIEPGAKVTVFDEHYRYECQWTRSGFETTGDAEWHGLGVVPVVRFPDEHGCDGAPPGKVWPLLPAQRQLNQTTFNLLMTQQYQAFKQRWVTGMAIQTDANGVDIQPFNPSVDSLFHAEDQNAKFGEFSQTDLGGYLDSRDKVLQYISAVAQIPPHQIVLGNGVSNLSAEALAALMNAHQRDIDEHKTTFGEATEQMIRLAGLAMGTEAGLDAWYDTSAQVVWRDTEPRSLPATIDALGKAATMLEVPVEVLWELWPGMTDATLSRWLAARERDSQSAQIRDMLINELNQPPAATAGNGAV